MARRATSAEVIAAMDVMLFPDAEVAEAELRKVTERLRRQRDADYEEFDWREGS